MWRRVGGGRIRDVKPRRSAEAGQDFSLANAADRGTKTDAIDALGIARFAAQKRPPAAQLPDAATEAARIVATARPASGGFCEPSEAVISSG